MRILNVILIKIVNLFSMVFKSILVMLPILIMLIISNVILKNPTDTYSVLNTATIVPYEVNPTGEIQIQVDNNGNERFIDIDGNTINIVKKCVDENFFVCDNQSVETTYVKAFEYDGITYLNYPTKLVQHIFFHQLVVNPSAVFDISLYESQSIENNQGTTGEDNNEITVKNQNRLRGIFNWMVTTDEFNSIIEQLYNNGYVLVNITDIAREIVNDDGTITMEYCNLYLPEGKKPLIISQDDVNYYQVNENYGFASKIVLDENGKPTCLYYQQDEHGNYIKDNNGDYIQTYGDYDLIPLLDRFIKSHPDFSFHGAKAILGITGYDGILGYRISEIENPEVKQRLIEVVQALKDDGYTFASHTYSHIDCANTSAINIKADTQKWTSEVASILGDTNILLFPYGADISSTGTYSNNKYKVLYDAGFRYFLNVDTTQKAWSQVNDDYYRGARFNIDGNKLFNTMLGNETKDKFKDYFNIDIVPICSGMRNLDSESINKILMGQDLLQNEDIPKYDIAPVTSIDTQVNEPNSNTEVE